MRVHIINEGGWILKRMADEVFRYLTENTGHDVQLGSFELVKKPADIYYYINYDLARKHGLGDGINVGYFTHVDDLYRDRWSVAEETLDIGIYMAERYKPGTKKAYYIPVPSWRYEIPEKPTIGICGRIYDGGRKGEDTVQRLIREIKGVRWIVAGVYWDSLDWCGADVSFKRFNGDDEMVHYYESIDLLLSAATTEGGSVPHLEACKVGTPILTFDVGNSELWGKFAIIVETYEQMKDELKRFVNLYNERKRLCDMDWNWFGEKHLEVFNKL